VENMKKKAAKFAEGYGVPLSIGNQIADIDMSTMFEGVKPFLQN